MKDEKELKGYRALILLWLLLTFVLYAVGMSLSLAYLAVEVTMGFFK